MRERALRIDHLGVPGHDGGQEPLLFGLRHTEVVKRAGDLHSDLVELLRRDVQILVGFVHVAEPISLTRPEYESIRSVSVRSAIVGTVAILRRTGPVGVVLVIGGLLAGPGGVSIFK
jgi:hypothetical protein